MDAAIYVEARDSMLGWLMRCDLDERCDYGQKDARQDFAMSTSTDWLDAAARLVPACPWTDSCAGGLSRGQARAGIGARQIYSGGPAAAARCPTSSWWMSLNYSAWATVKLAAGQRLQRLECHGC